MIVLKAGSTSQSIYITVRDSTSTTGGRKTGLVFNTSGLIATYTRQGGSATSITLATLAAANSAYSSGGFKEVDATKHPGLYRLDIPDAAIAAGSPMVVVTITGAVGMVTEDKEIMLSVFDLQSSAPDVNVAQLSGDSTAADKLEAWMDALLNNTAQAGAAGTITLNSGASASDDYYKNAILLITGGTGVGQFRSIKGYVGSTKVATVSPNWVTNPDNTSTFILFPAGQVDVGMVLGAVINALQSGRLDSYVGAMAANVLTATAIANDAITAAKIADGAIDAATFTAGAIDNAAIATDAIGSAEVAASAVTKIQAGLSTYAGGDTSGVTTLLGRLTSARAGYLDNLNVGAVASAAKLLKYFQLALRKDSAIATDNTTEMVELNTNGGSGAGAYDNTTDAQEALRDRGDSAWVTGGGGSISDILNIVPLIPVSVDLAATASFRLGMMLTNAVDDLPSTAEITPGTIDIDRKAIGGTSWTNIVSAAACSEAAGLIYYDAVFAAGSGYAEGDSLRITFKSQKITVSANDYEITDSTGRAFYTEIRQTERGTNGAYTSTPPTVTQIRTEMDSNSTQLAKLGTPATSVSADIAAVKTDTNNVATRLTALRAGYLDNLNIGGNVAASSEVVSIQNNTRVVRVVPDVFERPDSSSTVFRIELLIYDEVGNMEAPDSAPTISVVNQSGTSRDSNLDSTTMSLVSTGRYRSTYTIDTNHALEELIFAFSVVEGSATRIYANGAQVVDTTAVDFTSSDRTNLAAIKTQTDKMAFTVANQIDANVLDWKSSTAPAMTGDAYARIGAAGAGLTNIGDTRMANLDAAVSTRLATAGYTAPDNADILLIKAKTDNLPAAPAAVGDIPTAVQNADALLNRDLAAGTDSGGRTVRNALRALRNKVTGALGILTVYKEDDTTIAWTAALTTDAAADPITGIDP